MADALPFAGVFPSGEAAGPFGRRLRRPRGARVPVILVTGFLGAGKTTLVKSLLESEAGRNTAVVVNEFGEIGIDQALLAPSAEGGVALLGNGCLCCAVRSDLEETFRQLFTDRARGAIPSFERVVLELSGADDPLPVLQTFLGERALAREYHIQSVIAVVDAATGRAALRDNPEARRQVALADRMVVSKSDLATSGEMDALMAELRALNADAPVRTADHGAVDPDFLLAESSLPAPSPLRADAPAHAPGLTSFVLRFDAPLPWRALTAALGLLCEMRGADLLRVKGLVAVEGCRGPVVIHAVRHLLHRPVELEAWPDAERASRLVFITSGDLARQPVEDLFRAVARLGPP
ncbi:CobW family GTP-binding protein [Falsiroseomonas oryziterrae]|uniref:CobW family GTP-binding protein n=1 Tax=Falsiroseomonas oryziterrae TaxID=2911368 RepID=UPI001F4492F9|nr:GTP-binding protein [Roseomonas sp. NPKOSM-4]